MLSSAYSSSAAPVNAGSYTAAVSFVMEQGYPQLSGVTVQYVIEKAAQTYPAPTLAAATTNSLTLNVAENAEYSMERAQVRLDELEQQQRERRQQTTENPWLAVCGQFKEEQALTEAMAHALIERVEIDAEDHVSITLRYQDEYRALLQLLAAAGEAVPA